MENLQIISDYIDILETHLGLDIIIYDECRLLSLTKLANLPQMGKWHTNHYCLKIKENKDLRHRCVHLKQDFVNKILNGEGVVKSTCYCGVTEYVSPIKCGEHLICLVSAVGFCGEVRDSTYKILSKRVGLTYEKFMSLRESALLKADDEQTVINAVKILSFMLEHYILEETSIAELLNTASRVSNEHIIRATEYIAQNFSKPIDAAAVANYCHISESHLMHLFSAVIGHGIAEEIRLCRLKYAEELLCTTEYSVRYISFICGFSSSDYFSTVFKKHFKESPLQYRKRKNI